MQSYRYKATRYIKLELYKTGFTVQLFCLKDNRGTNFERNKIQMESEIKQQKW